MTKYTTQVTAYGIDENTSVLSIEIPEQFITDLDLKVNEVIEWDIDPVAKVATITKTNIIINPIN